MPQKDIRDLTNKTYSIGGELPVLAYRYFYAPNPYTGEKEPCYTGSIVRRPGTGSAGIMWHYCFVYGTGEDGTMWVVHNDSYGVEVISWVDYMESWDYYEVRDRIVSDEYFDEIMTRAKKRARLPFNLVRNNCEHFVNYAVFGTLESYQAQAVEMIYDLAGTFVPFLEKNKEAIMSLKWLRTGRIKLR